MLPTSGNLKPQLLRDPETSVKAAMRFPRKGRPLSTRAHSGQCQRTATGRRNNANKDKIFFLLDARFGGSKALYIMQLHRLTDK